MTGYGRNLRGDGDSGGVTDQGRPAEGSLFDWLGNNGVPYDVLGEIVGGPSSAPPGHNPIDAHYPGGIIQSIGYPDVEKACYVAGRARVLCDLGNVDLHDPAQRPHPAASPPARPPRRPCSPSTTRRPACSSTPSPTAPCGRARWSSSLEDDPSMGGESVDYHRTILVMVSPWMKRGYVSHAHVDMLLGPQDHRQRLRPALPQPRGGRARPCPSTCSPRRRTSPPTPTRSALAPSSAGRTSNARRAAPHRLVGLGRRRRAARPRRPGDALAPRPAAHRADPGSRRGHAAGDQPRARAARARREASGAASRGPREAHEAP